MKMTFPVRVLTLALPMMMGQVAVGQDCSFDLGPDTVLCNGGSLVLEAPAGALSYTWSTGSSSAQITVGATDGYWCQAVFPQASADLVVNGDFSLGAVSFTSDYIPGTGGTYGLLSLEGQYATATSPLLTHNNFADFGDHTTGTGNMMVVNGASVPGQNIWCQTVNVLPGTNYAFSAWLASCVGSSPAQLVFSVNGQIIGDPLLASATVGQWLGFYSLWNSGTATSATLCIVNQNTAVSGNDFALDDIAFESLCQASDTVQVVVLPEPPLVVITGGDALCPGTSTILTASLDPAGWPLTDVVYTWSTGEVGPDLLVEEPGSYGVYATGYCLDEQAVQVVSPDTCGVTLVMPNVFSPNGDGQNDVFAPIIDGQPSDLRLEIWNRWGQVVFQGSGSQVGWDGRLNGSQVADGTYFWVVSYGERLPDGSVADHEASGHVTLLGRR